MRKNIYDTFHSLEIYSIPTVPQAELEKLCPFRFGSQVDEIFMFICELKLRSFGPLQQTQQNSTQIPTFPNRRDQTINIFYLFVVFN